MPPDGKVGKPPQDFYQKFRVENHGVDKLKGQGIPESDIIKLTIAAKLTGQTLDQLADQLNGRKVEDVIGRIKVPGGDFGKIAERYIPGQNGQGSSPPEDVDVRTESAIRSAGVDDKIVGEMLKAGLDKDKALRMIVSAQMSKRDPSDFVGELSQGKSWTQVIGARGLKRSEIEAKIREMKGGLTLTAEERRELSGRTMPIDIDIKVAALAKTSGKNPRDIIDLVKQGKSLDRLVTELRADALRMKEEQAKAEATKVEREIEEEAARAGAPGQAPLANSQELKIHEADLRTRLGANPADHLGRVRLAQVLTRLGKVQEASANLRQVLESDPTNTHALMAMARRLKESGDLTGSREHLDRLNLVQGESTVVLSLKSEVLENEGKVEEAISAIEKAVSQDPRAAHLRQRLSTLYHQAQKQGVPVEEIKVFVEGQKPKFDVLPVIENSRTLVPLRAMAEAVGAEVNWDAATQTITLVKGERRISMAVNSDQAEVGGQKIKLDVAAKIKDGRTMVPLRFVGEALDAEVTWDGDSKMITVLEK